MTHAYDEKYLDDAMRTLGEAFDYAVNYCGINPDIFMDNFVTGGLAKQFEKGVPKYLAGMSGIELTLEILKKTSEDEFVEVDIEYNYTPEYWAGWILAYYQWFTGNSFKNINKSISMEEILRLYPTLHEAPEEKFVETVNMIISRNKGQTNLQMLRRVIGYSQKMLSEKSGVSLRMVQQYEQRAKNINKATAKNLFALSKTLGCQMEDLLENEVNEEKET